MTDNPSLRRQFASDRVRVAVSTLRMGSRLRRPIHDEEDRLLLSADTILTPNLLGLLAQRGIQHVNVDGSEVARLTSAALPPAPIRSEPTARVESLGDNAAALPYLSPDSYVHKVHQPGATPFSPHAVGEFANRYQRAVDQTEDVLRALATGVEVDPQIVASLTQESLLQLTTDIDLFLHLGIKPDADRYPFKHGLQTSMLAMAIGTVMGLKKEEILDMSIGCILHDVGMLRIDRRIYEAPRPLTSVEFLEITKHPTITFEMIKALPGLSAGSRLVAYQIHERYNGSGYPRRVRGKQIHYLARIAAVADTFVARISPRPHRRALLPYAAVEELVRGAGQGLYDPDAVRGLLHTVSLFPIGSFVQLQGQLPAQVMRSNRDNYARPVVAAPPTGLLAGEQVLLDLSVEDMPSIERALSPAEAAALAEFALGGQIAATLDTPAFPEPASRTALSQAVIEQVAEVCAPNLDSVLDNWE